MKERYRAVCVGNRGGTYYFDDAETGERLSLHTKDEAEAQRLVRAKNEALRQPHINRKIGMAYLSATDPALATRIWDDVMKDLMRDKTGSNLHRYETAYKDKAFKRIKQKVVVTTLPDDFKVALRAGGIATNVYLRRYQNYALNMGWLPVPILPKALFPKVKHKEKRAITCEEHCRIIAREKNPERRDYYELCWHLGGSQTDVATLNNDDIDRRRRCFTYARHKTHNLGGTRIGREAWKIIERRPESGPLFPYLQTVREADRATEFKQRCQGLGIQGVTLHSYRYAWAERSANSGYPERYAQRALGQNSKIVHRAYAKKAQGQLPSLEEYEEAKLRADKEGKILVLEYEAEVPKVA